MKKNNKNIFNLSFGLSVMFYLLFTLSTYIHKCKKNKIQIKEQYKFLLEQSYCIKSFTNANLHAINGRQRIWCKNITWIWM